MRILQIWPSSSNSTWNTSSFYSRAMRRAGVQVANFIYSDELILQNLAINAFRGTNDEVYEGEAILLSNRMLMGWVASAQPQCVLICTGLDVYKSAWKWLWDFRLNLKNPYKIVTIYTESPYRPSEEIELAQYSDYVFTNEREFVEPLRNIQPRTWYLPQAYDDEKHTPGKSEHKYGTYMCGSGFLSRIQLLAGVNWEQTGAPLTLKGLWPDIDASSKLAPYYTEGLVKNEGVVEDYRASDICLNVHRQEGEIVIFERDTERAYAREKGKFKIENAYSMNNRTCEIAATGAFQMDDDTREEVVDVFGDSVPRFSMDDPAGLEEMIAFYAHRPELRDKLAQEARMRIEGRTYLSNAKRILNLIGG